MNIFEKMREQMIDHLLEKRFKGDKEVDKRLVKLSSSDENEWMQELFSGKENVSQADVLLMKKKVLHGYHIDTFADIHFHLKNRKFSFLGDYSEQEIEESKRKEREEREVFLNLSLEEKVEYIDSNITCKVTEIGASKRVLEDYLKNPLTIEVRRFIKNILKDERKLEKVQVVTDGSYFTDVVLVRFDELLPTKHTLGNGHSLNYKEVIKKMFERSEVLSLNIDYQSKRQAYSDEIF